MVGGVGVGKWVENDFGVQTEQAIYDWIDTGTKWRRTDRVKFRDAIASKKDTVHLIYMFWNPKIPRYQTSK